MALTIEHLAARLATGGLRHHLDAAEGVIRVVFVTRRYTSPRLERLAILQLEVTDGGTSCRVSLPRAFAAGRDPAATCLHLCDAVGDVPLARVEHDVSSNMLQLAAHLPVEDAEVTPRQIFALLDAVVEAAEAGQEVVESRGDSDRREPAGREAA